MAGVERLMVVNHPLADNPEDHSGPGIVQQGGDFLRSFNITPEVAVIGAGVGLFIEPGLRGPTKGFIAASLVSMALNYFNTR